MSSSPSYLTARQGLREAMPITERWAYFDHAAVAPLSGPARQALAAWADQAAREGDTVWLDWDRRVEQTRRLAARLIGADADEIALVPNTTAGINLVAEGIEWRAGDNVVVLDDEFPSNLFPWMNQERRGVQTRRLPTEAGRVDFDRLRALCDERTRVVSVSWVGYASGYRQDIDRIAEIAHAAGGATGERAHFFLDAIQGMGVFPLDVSRTPIDFLAADGHKWMLGPEGAGVAYVRKELLERLTPLGVGWNSVEGAYHFSGDDFTLKRAASRYEGGSANMPGMHALAANLELLQRWPAEEITQSLVDLTDYLCERLASVGAVVTTPRAAEPSGHDPRSGIVLADLPGASPAAARKRLAEAHVAVSVRGGRLRMSPHAYTVPEEVDRLVDALGPLL